MLIPTIIMGVIAIVLTFIAYNKGGGEHILGLESAGSMLLQIVPLYYIHVDRYRIWFPRSVNWFSTWWSYTGWSLC